MSDQLDAILQAMSELTDTVKEHQNADDEATIDYDKLAEVTLAQLQALEKDKLEKARAARPIGSVLPCGTPCEGAHRSCAPRVVIVARRV